MIRAALLIIVLLWHGVAAAHVTDLAVLKLNGIGDGRYTVAWELRPNTVGEDALEPIFPKHCTRDGASLDCGASDLVGQLGFENIGAGQSAAMFKIRDLDGSTRVFTVTPAQPFADVGPALSADSWAGKADILRVYALIGFEHILLGVDHLLFVLGLIWISTGRWMLFKTITAFTVAHSVTLGAVTFGWVGVPETFVNAMIALSIVFIGVEVLHARRGRQTITLTYPYMVSFAFGLLHGFGFANALIALGLPEDAIPLALLAFNIGVELGQIAFVLLVIAMTWAYRVMQVPWPGWSHIAPAYLIGGIAAFWFFERAAILMGVST